MEGHGWLTAETRITDDNIAQANTINSTGVSSNANCWRTISHPRKIKQAAIDLYSPEIATDYFGKTPGRCIRSRWLAVESVEKVIQVVKDKPWLPMLLGEQGPGPTAADSIV